MSRAGRFVALGAAALVVAAAFLVIGCGQKISVPQPAGLFSVAAYYPDSTYADDQPIGLTVASNSVFVLTATGTLTKRTIKYEEIARVASLQQPTAICRADYADRIIVWEQGAGRLKVLNSTDLAAVDSSQALAEVQGVIAMATCRTAIVTVAGANTFVYLADPDAGVIHRYAYSEGGTFESHGILARRDGNSARSVHEPAGMAVDAAGMLLVCDADTARNWVIRFDPTPDATDLTPVWNGGAPERGLAIPFDVPTCNPPSLSEVTLGYAAECGQTDWQGRRGSANGEFDVPQDVCVDGSGQIFVADTGNNRVQIFTPKGVYAIRFGNAARTPAPTAMGTIDWRVSVTKVNYGAYLFAVIPGHGEVRRFISAAQYIYVNQQPPPPPS